MEGVFALDGEEESDFVEWRAKGFKEAGSVGDPEWRTGDGIIGEKFVQRVIGDDGVLTVIGSKPTLAQRL